jgi:hypothetical protein
VPLAMLAGVLAPVPALMLMTGLGLLPLPVLVLAWVLEPVLAQSQKILILTPWAMLAT